MAVRGVWQLNKLIVSYCDFTGGSRGIRDFIENRLSMFKAENPQLEVVEQLLRGRDPYLKGCYANKNERVVGVRNLTSTDILTQATRLRNSTGRKVVKLKSRHTTGRPSIQGTWTAEMKL